MQSETPEFLKDLQIVRAGAGAGKTRNLTLRVLDWVEAFHKQNDRAPKLVVTTFTVKATQELRERLLLFAGQRENDFLIDYVRSSSYLQISTIHGVLTNFLRKYGHAVGLDSGFDVLSGTDNRKSFFYWARRIFEAKPELTPLLNTYNFKELTKYLSHYYESYLLGNELKPVTSADVQRDLESRFADFKTRSFAICTQIQSMANGSDSKAKAKENYLNFANAFLSIKETEFSEMEESLNRLIAIIGRMPSNPKANPIIDADLAEEAKALWAEVKEIAAWPEDIFPSISDYQEQNQMFADFAEVFVEEFLKDRLQQSKISMADIEFLSAYLLRKHPNLAYSFAEEYDYWLIDEFQDTSPEQLNLLKPLIDESPYYLVGDPQQSIYFFRGADQSLFHKEEKAMLEGAGKHQLLMKNYRTKPDCMEFINAFMGKFSFESMETREYKEGENPDSPAAEFFIGEDTELENEFIGNRVAKLLSDGVAASDICILGRTKKSLAEIANVLRQKGIPHYLHSSGSFFDKREVLDLLALLKFLVHSFDTENLIELLRSPWFYLEDLKIFDYQDRGMLHWESLSKEKHPSLQRLKELKDFAEEYGLSAALEKSIFDSGMLELSRDYDPSGKREANIWKFLSDLREEERKPFFSPLSYLRKADEFAEVSNEGELEAAAALEPNMLQLMTIHASKGLEFRHVFVCRMNKKTKLSLSLDFYKDEEKFSLPVPQGSEGTKRLPLFAKNQLEEIKEKEKAESFRLLYVALTRAEEALYLSWSDKVEKNSWVENLEWDLSSDSFKTDKYSYIVHREYPEVSYQRKASKAQAAIAPWKNIEEDYFKPLETESVSRLLEQRTEYGRQQKKGEEDQFFSAGHFKERMDRAAQGTKQHLILENYVASVISGKEDEFLQDRPEAKEVVDSLLALEGIPFLDLIPKAKLEWGFLVKGPAGNTIEGQIDFWSEDEEGTLWVVDYKTGSSRYAEKAVEQLGFYAYALKKFYPESSIKLAALYLKDSKVVIKDFDPSKLEEWT